MESQNNIQVKKNYKIISIIGIIFPILMIVADYYWFRYGIKVLNSISRDKLGDGTYSESLGYAFSGMPILIVISLFILLIINIFLIIKSSQKAFGIIGIIIILISIAITALFWTMLTFGFIGSNIF